MTLTDNSSGIKNDNKGPLKHPHHYKQLQGHNSMYSIALKSSVFTCWWRNILVTTSTLGILTIRWQSLKLVSAVFYQIFIFHEMIALQKLWQMFFISPKKLFSFSRYSSFCIFFFPSFFPCQPLLLRLILEKS